ncbi:hypothetical protein CPY51_09015 [Rhizobium tubonense]|uniref:Uncharacterized protein n=1 Tax=Rhizobium tubonense TaxID=484088 RepID=A0A2W4CQL5_9HYPH|nr:hypothetical protein [Rhizobium tubonense]PZM14839.1 hypothetical protein CPY51_09015 [Rhizobium tubonense]
MTKGTEKEYRIISQAVQAWYRFYGDDWDDEASSFLCSAAIKLYNGGCRSTEDLATTLIGTYVGLAATRVYARSSVTLH